MKLRFFYMLIYFALINTSCNGKEDTIIKKSAESKTYYIALTTEGAIIKIDTDKRTIVSLKDIKKVSETSFNDVNLNNAITVGNDVYIAYHTYDKNSLFQLKIAKYDLVKDVLKITNVTLPETIKNKEHWSFTSFYNIGSNNSIATISNMYSSVSKILKVDLDSFSMKDLNVTFESNGFFSSAVVDNKFYYGSSLKRSGISVFDLDKKETEELIVGEKPYCHKLSVKDDNTIITVLTVGDTYRINEIKLDDKIGNEIFTNQKGLIGAFPGSGGRGFYDKKNSLYIIPSFNYKEISPANKSYKLSYFFNEYNLKNQKINKIKFNSNILMESVILGRFQTNQ